MHVAIVTEGIPHPGGSGGAIFTWTVLNQLKDFGCTVSAFVVENQFDSRLTGAERQARVSAIQDLGVDIRVLSNPQDGDGTGGENRDHSERRGTGRSRLSKLLRPNPEDFFPSFLAGPELKCLIEATRPDVVYVFDTGLVGALRDVHVVPRMATPGDPLHLVWRYRLQLTPLRKRLSKEYVFNLTRFLFASRKLQRWLIAALADYDSVGFLGAQHAQWVRNQGLPCVYLPLPLIDMARSDWKKRRQELRKNIKPRVLLFGQPATTAGLSGLYCFANEILPILDQSLDKESYEVHIVGSGELPGDLKKALDHECVYLRGYVEDAETECLSADVVLAPSPYPVGVRVRIVHALSLGCCVVAHRLSAAGLPELINNQNSLLASDGEELATAVIEILRDGKLRRRIEEDARKTYEGHFHPVVAVGKIACELRRITPRRDENSSLRRSKEYKDELPNQCSEPSGT